MHYFGEIYRHISVWPEEKRAKPQWGLPVCWTRFVRWTSWMQSCSTRLWRALMA
jgi:hypothetical protein